MSAELVGRDSEIGNCAIYSQSSGWSRSSARRRRQDGRRDRDGTHAGATGWRVARPARDREDRRRRRRHGRSPRSASTGGEAALGAPAPNRGVASILDNCEHVVEAAATLAVRLLDAAPDARVLCTSQVPLDLDGEAVVELAPLALADAVELFTVGPPPAHDRGTRRPRRGCASCADRSTACRWRSSSRRHARGRCRSRRSPAGSTTASRAERPDEPQARTSPALEATIGWSYDLLFPDDQRGCGRWPPSPAAHRSPAVESVLDALDVPAAAAIDIVGRLASRSLVIVDDESSHLATGCSTASGPSPSRRWPRPGSPSALRGARRVVRGRGRPSTDGVRSSAQAEHLAFARTERANIDAALAWSAAHDPLLGLELVNGFGWAWIVLGDGRGAQRSSPRSTPQATTPPARERATALLLAAWIEASPGDLEPARRHIAAATELADGIDDVDLEARCAYYLAYVVSHDGEFEQAMELTDRAGSSTTGSTAPGTRPQTRSSPPEPRSPPATEHAPSQATRQVQHWLEAVDDPWLHVRRDASSASSPALEHRFDDAVATSPGQPRRRDDSATCRPRPTSSPASAAPSARPAITIRRGHAPTGDRQGRDHRRRPAGRARPDPPRTRPARTRRTATGSRHARGGRRMAPRSAAVNKRARRVPARGDGPRRWRTGAERTTRRHPRRRPPTTTKHTSKSSPSTHSPGCRITTRRHHHGTGSVRRQPTAAWKPLPTSSPTSTGPTPTVGSPCRPGGLDHDGPGLGRLGAPTSHSSTTNTAIAAVAMTSPAMPMNTVVTTPSAAMAPRAPRIGPMQQATQATAAKPRISRRLMPPSRTDRRRCRRPPRRADLQRGAAVVDGDGEGEELTAALFGAHDTAEVADVDAGVELDPQAAV